MQNDNLNDHSRHYPIIAQFLLSPDHETFKHGILLGESLELLVISDDHPGYYHDRSSRHVYELRIWSSDFAQYLQQNHPDGPQQSGTQYINYKFRPDINYYSMTVNIDT